MNLKIMLAPAIMGMAFMGLISTVNVVVADEVDDMANQLQSALDQASALDNDALDESMGWWNLTPCEKCAGKVAFAIGVVSFTSDVCNAMEDKLNVWREQCKQAKGVTPSSPFKDKCDAVTNGKYTRLLDKRQDCRDGLGYLVTWRNGVEHSCYGAPLYCGMDPGWPY